MRVLFVDDTKDTTDMFCLCFNIAGHFARGATSAPQAMQYVLLEPDNYDVIIVDYHMPEMDGLEVARCVKARAPEVPIILFTGHSGREIESAARDAGIACVAYKPITPDQLITLACNVVNGQKDSST
jgi:CheY-like chemotaxis protein